MDSHAGRSLVGTRHVVGEPANDTRNRWIDAAGGNENASIANLGIGRSKTPGEEKY